VTWVDPFVGRSNLAKDEVYRIASSRYAALSTGRHRDRFGNAEVEDPGASLVRGRNAQ
jgi:hypothetical protein